VCSKKVLTEPTLLEMSGNPCVASLALSIRFSGTLERGRFNHLDGPSGRTRHLNLEETLIPRAERLTISGISSSEFPEPIGIKLAYNQAFRRRKRAGESPTCVF
jgi:hypothetical protein